MNNEWRGSRALFVEIQDVLKWVADTATSKWLPKPTTIKLMILWELTGWTAKNIGRRTEVQQNHNLNQKWLLKVLCSKLSLKAGTASKLHYIDRVFTQLGFYVEILQLLLATHPKDQSHCKDFFPLYSENLYPHNGVQEV